MSETPFENVPGYALWHRLLGHCPMQTISDTIPHAKGIEELSKASFDPNQQCPACMVGNLNAYQEIRPRPPERAQLPLERVYMDIVSSSIISIEAYNYALIIADDASMYLWVYGLKDKSKANDTARKWICYILQFRAA